MWTETWLFTKRSLVTTIRNLFSFIPNLIISVFFLTRLYERVIERRLASAV